MANYDGDITLSVDLEPGDVKSTANSLRKDIDDIFKSTAGKELSSSFKSLQSNMSKAYQKAGQILQRMKELEETSVPTKEFEALEKQYEKLLGQLGTLSEQKERFLATGGRTGSRAFAGMEYDMDRVNERINEVLGQMAELRKEGSAAILGEDTQEYAKLSAQLIEVNNQMTTYKQRALESQNLTPDTSKWEIFKNSIGTVSSILSKVIYVFRQIVSGAGAVASKFLDVARAAGRAAVNIAKVAGQSTVNGIKALGKGVGSLVGHFRNLGSAIKRSNKSGRASNDIFKKGFMTFLRYGLGIRSVYFLFRRLRKALGEGIGNLAQYSPAFNNVISNFISALTQLKNTFATAFAPIINVVAPILTTFINLVSAAVTRIGMLIAALTGQNTFIRATAVQENFAGSLDNAAGSAGDATKAAEKYKRTIAGFDDVEILKNPDDSSGGGSGGGGGGGGGISPTDMFETVDIPESLQDWADKLKDAWAHADFTGIGDAVGTKLAEALNDIPWKKVQEKANRFGSSFATFLNGLFESDIVTSTGEKKTLGTIVGESIGNVINTGLTLWEGFVDKFHFDSMGAFIADGMNGMVITVNWEKLSNNLVKTANGVLDAAETWTDKFKFGEAGTALRKSIKGIFNDFDFDQLNWTLTKFGKGLAEFVTGFFTDNPLTSVGDAFGNALDAVLTGADSFISNLPTETIGEDLAGAMNGVFSKKKLWEDLATLLSDTANGIFKLASTWSGKFKFGQMGTSIRTAITDTLDNLNWDDAKTAVKNIASGIATALNNIMTEDTFESVGTAIGNGINLAVTGIHDFVSGINWDNWATNLGSGINTFFDTINWDDVHVTFNSVTTALANAINAAFNTLKTITFSINWNDWGTALGEDINTFFDTVKWDEIGVTFTEVATKVADGLASAIETIDFETVGSDVATALANVDWKKLFDTAGKLLEVTAEAFGEFLDGLLGTLGEALSAWFEENVPTEIQEFFATVKDLWEWLTGTDWGFGDVDPNGNLGQGTIKESGLLPEERDKYNKELSATWTEGSEEAVDKYNAAQSEEVEKTADGKTTNNYDTKITGKDGYVNIGDSKATKTADGATTNNYNTKITGKNGYTSIGDSKVTKKVDGQVLEAYTKLQKAWNLITTQVVTKKAEGKKEKTYSTLEAAWAAWTDENVSKNLTAEQLPAYWEGYDAFNEWIDSEVAKKLVANEEPTYTSLKKLWDKWDDDEAKKKLSSVFVNEKAWEKKEKSWFSIHSEKAKKTIKSVYENADKWNSKLKSWGSIVSETAKKTIKSKYENKEHWDAATKHYNNDMTNRTATVKLAGEQLQTYKNAKAALDNLPKEQGVTIKLYGKKTSSAVNAIAALVDANSAHYTSSQSKMREMPYKRGGAFFSGMWHNIAQYASGGVPRHGTRFVAGEAGPEVVGHIGGRTEVLNQSQLAATMYSAVINGSAKAIGALMSHLTNCTNSINANLGYTIDSLSTQIVLMDNINSAVNTMNHSMTDIAVGKMIPNSIVVNQDTNNTLHKMADMLQYNQNNQLTRDDFADIMATLFERYMNINFYMGDEQVARHANAGNAKLNRRFDTQYG